MSDLILNQIVGSINLMPLNGIRICTHLEVGEGETNYIHKLEEESSYRISPKTRDDRKGGKITLGYDVEAICYISHNDYGKDDMLERLEALKDLHKRDGISHWHFILMIGDKIQSSPQKGVINTYPGKGFWIELNSPKITIEMESVQLRPRLILRTNQFIKSLKSVILT